MWDLPGPGLERLSPALAGGFLTTEPPGKPRKLLFYPEILPTVFKLDRGKERHRDDDHTSETLAFGSCLG